MMKILIGYDGSESADAALHDLQRAGLPDDAEALIISVADVMMAPATSNYEIAEQALTSRRVTAGLMLAQKQTVIRGECSFIRLRSGMLIRFSSEDADSAALKGSGSVASRPRWLRKLIARLRSLVNRLRRYFELANPGTSGQDSI